MDGNNGYTLRLSDKASEDLFREIEFLNFELDSLGEEFYDEIQQTLNRIVQNPFMYVEKILFVRRGLLKKFKFQIFYAVDEINYDIEIIGILHQKQNPAIILQRLNIDY